VLLAFGAVVEEMCALNENKVQIVGMSCPWVSKFSSAFEDILLCSSFYAT
jgi:4-hydroxy-3-methylbut-2-enyl diphosphate reductase IspH